MIDLKRAQSITKKPKNPVTSSVSGDESEGARRAVRREIGTKPFENPNPNPKTKDSVVRGEVFSLWRDERVRKKFINSETKDLNDHG